jgi:pimeloyl-ACP methyl ester carboxylesterase
MIALLLITLAVGQLMVVSQNLLGASLTGRHRLPGYVVGGLLFVAGWAWLPADWGVLWWTPVAVMVTMVLLMLTGSFFAPIPAPEHVFFAENSVTGTGQPVFIPDGDFNIPGIMLTPPVEVKQKGLAVCIIHGAGDTKTSFKWLLVQSLLAAGITVLTIDLPGHGDYRHRPLTASGAVQTVITAGRFLRRQPGISTVGLVGISLGGAVAVSALRAVPHLADSLVIFAMPVSLQYSRKLFYKVVWNTFCCAPVIGLLRDTTGRQARQTWKMGGYNSHYDTSHFFEQLNALEKLKQLTPRPLLLVYSRRDAVAPPHHFMAIRQVAPGAAFIEVLRSSHVTITLLPEVNQQVSRWLTQQIEG